MVGTERERNSDADMEIIVLLNKIYSHATCHYLSSHEFAADDVTIFYTNYGWVPSHP